VNVREATTISLVRQLCRSGEARRIREAHRLSRAETAAVIGTSATQLSRWESGVEPRRLDTILRYAELLRELEELDS
jgi:transcriptional regulator with XRE-family HTH domain